MKNIRLTVLKLNKIENETIAAETLHFFVTD